MTQKRISFHPDNFAEPWQCGGWATLLKQDDITSRPWYCRRVACPTCGPVIQNMHLYKICLSFERLKSPMLFYKIITGLSGKMVSNAVQRQTRGSWVCIRTRPPRAVIVSTHQLKDKSALRTHRTVLFRKLLPAWLMLLRNGGGRVSLSKQLRVTWSSLCGQQQGRLFINSRLIKARLSKDEIGMLWGFWDTQQKRASGVYLAAFPWVSSIKLDAQKPLQSAMYLARKQRKGARIYKPGKKLIALVLLLTQLSMRLAQMQRKPFVLKSYRKRLKALLS